MLKQVQHDVYMSKKLFITGISTDVGKTVASAIITEALEADYWKPVQAGELNNCDTKRVERLVSNNKSKFHQNSYALKTPMSPHAAAEMDNLTIDVSQITTPKTKNDMVIEGAGGLLVPLNDTETILDLIRPNYKVIVVSRHYLGSINHTLLTVNWLKQKGYDVSLIFSGDENPTTENIILHKTGVSLIGRIEQEAIFDKKVILKYADTFRSALISL
jgi:dethiobiotin synthetase